MRIVSSFCKTSLFLRTITGTMLVVLFIVGTYYAPPVLMSLLFGMVLGTVLIVEWPRLCQKNTLLYLLTPLYPILPCIILAILNYQESTHDLFIWLVLTVASFDTGSYITGTVCGRHPIAPTISAGKSWEGFFGGCITALLASYAIIYWQGFFLFSHERTVVCVMLVCFSALAGDLFESALKRRVQVKDSGTLLPGHGGILDRIDGILACAFLVYWQKSLFLTLFSIRK